MLTMLLSAACQFDTTEPPHRSAVQVDSGSGDLNDPDLSTLPDEDADDVSADSEDLQEMLCTEDADCADMLECTSESCNTETGLCERAVESGTCLINNVCYASGDSHPSDPCSACDSSEPGTWSGKQEGAACDDGSLCTIGTTCTEGLCIGLAVECEDANGCTSNECDPTTGCIFPPANEGESCDDGNECTLTDTCREGRCFGTTRDCDDEDVCTDDACDPESGCVNVFNTAPCSDDDACTEFDVCSEGVCIPGDEPNCNDGNICTIDGCDEVAGCFHLVKNDPCCVGNTSVCDDGNPCTDDLCNDSGGCDRVNNDAACDDQNACTEADSCVEGACGGAERTCVDTNECTDDTCNPATGCLFIPLNGDSYSCTDGFDCTEDDVCVEGSCQGDDSACVCEPEFHEPAAKLTLLAIGAGGHPGEALDLDGDPTTCSPETDCSEGRNNALGILAGIVNPPMTESVQDGSVMLVLEFRDYDRNPFELAVYSGELDTSNADCDHLSEQCDYWVSADGMDPTCEPAVSMAATRSGDRVFAGGRGTEFPFEVPFGESTLTLTLYDVIFEGTVTESDSEFASISGILAGAVTRGELLAAIEGLDADSLPFSPDSIASLLNTVVVDDIDTDGTGEPNAASIAIKMEGIPAIITGLAE